MCNNKVACENKVVNNVVNKTIFKISFYITNYITKCKSTLLKNIYNF